ncbi:MAG TPA: hypothetical protein VGQ80_03785 [Acidimicrobiia bacterium]|nr:hypothetical protein [Acidimicrobiia bacterium]
MSRRMWTGLLVGLLVAIGLVAGGAGAYHAGERDSGPVATVVPGTGVAAPDGTVRVIGYDHWRGGPPFGFPFPLLFIGLIVLLVTGRRRAYWGRPHGPWYGPGGWGGPGGPEGGRETMLADWHRRAHGEPAHPTDPASAAQAPPGAAPPGVAPPDRG